MRFQLIFGTLAAFSLLIGEFGLSSEVSARDEGMSDTPDAVSTVSKEEIERIVDQRFEDIMRQSPQNTPATDFSQPATVGQTKKSQSYLDRGRQDWVTGGSVLEGGRTIYAKPFVRAPKTIVGGYIDFTISDCNNAGSRDCREELEFDQERLVPFLLLSSY